MKKLLSIIGVAALLATGVQAQTTNSAPNSGTFFSSLTDYFTSFNTNNDETFSMNRGKLFTGVASIQGGHVPLANVVGLTYDIYKATNSAVSISIESETLNSGVAGTIVSQEVGAGINFNVHDTELTAFAHGGYDFTATGKDTPYFGVVGLRVLKALTIHTYAGMEIAMVVPQNEQRFEALAGFTF